MTQLRAGVKEVPIRAFTALVVAVLAAGAGCGGGGGSSSGAAKREITPHAQEQMESIVLKLSDFPNGWRASPPSAEDTATQRKFRKCIGVDLSNVTLEGDARSKDFAMGDTASASSEARKTTTPAQAKDGLQRLAKGLESPAIKGCFREAAAKISGFKFGEVKVSALKFDPPPDVDEARGWETVIPVEVTTGPAAGTSATVYFDAVFLRNDNVLADVQTSDAESPLAPALRDKLVQTVARRMSQSST